MRFSMSLLALVLAFAGCTPSEPAAPEPPETEVEILRPIELTQNALLPESDARLMDVEIYPDRLVFIYSSAPAQPPTVDHVVSGILHGGYLRRITGVIANSGTRIEVATVPAELTELIGDGHFRVLFHPRDGEASFRVVDGAGVATGALEGGWSLLTPEIRNISCGGGAGGEINVRPTFDMDVDAEIDIDIEWSTRWLVVPRGELARAIFVLDGQVEAGATIETSGNRSMAACRSASG
jgi:hypothetical protein